MDNYFEMENMTQKRIVVTLDWNSGARQQTTVQPGEIAEITCGDSWARICHRSDGGAINECPLDSPIAKRGDFFQLEEDGGFSG
jgi:hypothetical protein